MPLINVHADVASEDRDLNLGLSPTLCMRAKCADESEHMRRLVRAFAASSSDKYQNLVHRHIHGLRMVIILSYKQCYLILPNPFLLFFSFFLA